jgi:hypothetical protein
LLGADFFRGRLIEERKALHLFPRRDASAFSSATPLEGGAVRQVVLASAGLGLFRALAVDFLWLRAVRLQENGQYFDAALLSRLITSLEPRISQVWNFQAYNLSYNISRTFPPPERYPWVLQGIELLKDEGLRFNPRSASIHHQLAFLFQHKIGLDFDDAGYLYRSELARAFEVSRQSREGLELFRKWRLEPERLQALEGKLGVDLDFRAAESHALYWAEQGLEALGQDSSSSGIPVLVERQLRHAANASLLQLFSGGHPIRAPVTQARGERLYAFVPDLRFLEAGGRVLEAELAARRPAAAALEEAYTDYLKKAISYLFLSGRRGEAEALFEKQRERLRPSISAGTPFAGALLEILLPGALEGSKEATQEALALSLQASLLLQVVGEEGSAEEALSRGFLELARWLHERLGKGTLPPFDAYHLLAAERLRERWKTDPRTEPLLTRLKLPSQASPPSPGAERPALPEPRELLFRLDRLDPLLYLKSGT